MIEKNTPVICLIYKCEYIISNPLETIIKMVGLNNTKML